MLRKALRRGGLVAVAVATTALAAACSSGGGSPATAQANYVGGSGGGVFPVGQRQNAPALSGPTLTGSTLSLASYRGKVVVLNIWASWCGPCRAEAPALEQVYQNTQGQGVAFIGIDTRDQNAQASSFEQNVGTTYPSMVDPDGSLQLNFDRTVPPQAVPDTMVIDRQGRIAAAFIGPVTYTEFSSELASIVAEKT